MTDRLVRRAGILVFVALAAATLAVDAQQGQQTDKALALRHDDPALQWGPCPDIFPKGCEVAVLRGDPVGGRADVFLRAPAGYTFPAHSHTSPEHMMLAAGELRIKYEGQPAATLKTGSYAYGPANAPHEAQCGNAGACVLFIVFESPIDAKPHKGTL